MMHRIPKGPKAAKVAAKIAEKDRNYYGWTVFGGDWFVGTPEELDRIGVAVPMPCMSIQLDHTEHYCEGGNC